MINRWTILAILVFARTTMAFQFQSLAALSPLVVERFGIGLADIGLLIGLYLAPGVLVALPGSAISARLGDKRVVVASLLVMLAGGILTSITNDQTVLALSRFMAGAGGVLLNIIMTKLLIDWFAGREISTAMSVYLVSWPGGIALASFILPWVAASGGIDAGWWMTAAFVGLGLLVFLAYQSPPNAAASETPVTGPVTLPYAAIIHAGLVWGLYNAAVAMVFSFGATLMTEAGWSLTAAGVLVSAFMLIFAAAAPLGGMIADRTGRRDATIIVSLSAFLVIMPLVPMVPATAAVALLLLLGVLSPLAAGPIMTLPSAVLPPQSRSVGMGIFFTIYYGSMMVAPRIAGGAADRFQATSVAFICGAIFAAGAIMSLLLYRHAAARAPVPQS